MTTHIKEDISSELAYIRRFSLLLTWWGEWQHVDRRGAGGTESSTFGSAGSRKGEKDTGHG